MPGAIGVDVGGTRIRVARIMPDGTAHDRRIEPVERSREGFAAQLARLVAAAREPATTAVGIGIPGRVRDGAILSAGYLDIAGLDVAALCAGLPARIENDATMALVAEARVAGTRAGRGDLVAMLTVGTGIGGAVVVDGRPWHGGGLAGQFGHLVVAAEGPRCRCGRTGCVETLSAGPAFARIAATHGLDEHRIEGGGIDRVLERAGAGHAASIAALDEWARPFARAIGTLVAAIDPRLVLVGGGLGAAMVRALARHPEPSDWFGVPVEAAALGDDAGVIGAGLAALDGGATRS